jgi:hypothetical protein
MTAYDSAWLSDVIEDFVQNSPENSLKMENEEKAFDEVLFGFSSGSDPLYEAYKDLVGELHWTPRKSFPLSFPTPSSAPKI